MLIYAYSHVYVPPKCADLGGAGSPSSGSPKGTASPKTPASALTPTSATAAAALDTFARPVQHEDPPIWRSIFRFLRHPRKPVILAMSRPDAKKNITTLVKAYGRCGNRESGSDEGSTVQYVCCVCGGPCFGVSCTCPLAEQADSVCCLWATLECSDSCLLLLHDLINQYIC
jgi:hypothetical protein